VPQWGATLAAVLGPVLLQLHLIRAIGRGHAAFAKRMLVAVHRLSRYDG
jgi:hypothetical protein